MRRRISFYGQQGRIGLGILLRLVGLKLGGVEEDEAGKKKLKMK
jgi:hypothetical protein